MGAPVPSGLTNLNQRTLAIGKPDSKAVPIGPGGEIVLEFQDNLLFDGPGPDLAVFQSGDAVKTLEVSVSTDRRRWIKVGQISDKPTIDIASSQIKSEDRFRFVKLVVLQEPSGGETPPAESVLTGAAAIAPASPECL